MFPSIPVARGALPVIGHAVRILADPLNFFSSLTGQGDLVKIKLGPVETVVVCDPELVQEALVKDRIFDKGGFFYDEVRRVTGNGLASCPHGQHRRQRRLTQPTFHSSRMPEYARIMSEQIDEGTAAWNDGQVLDVVSEMMSIAGSVLASTIFSGSLPVETRRTLAKSGEVLIRGAFRQMIFRPPWDRLPYPGRRRYRNTIADFREIISEIIANRRQSSTDQGDLLSALLSATDDGDRLSDSEVFDQVAIFVIAGQETTARTLAWALLMVSQRPELQRRLQEEVDGVLTGDLAVYEDLPNLPLTRMIVTETLRMWPSAWILTRKTTTEVELGGYTLPAGTDVAISPYVSGRRDDLFVDPDEFDPDRWAPERGTVVPRGFMVPFGWGSRKCIGDTFAVNEIALVLATIAARWQFDAVPGTEVRALRGILLTPGNLQLRLSARARAMREEPVVS